MFSAVSAKQTIVRSSNNRQKHTFPLDYKYKHMVLNSKFQPFRLVSASLKRSIHKYTIRQYGHSPDFLSGFSFYISRFCGKILDFKTGGVIWLKPDKHLACHQSEPRLWCQLWTAARWSEELRPVTCLLWLWLPAAAQNQTTSYIWIFLSCTPTCFVFGFLPADPSLSPRTACPVCSPCRPARCSPHGGALSTPWNTPRPNPCRPERESGGPRLQTPADQHMYLNGWTPQTHTWWDIEI